MRQPSWDVGQAVWATPRQPRAPTAALRALAVVCLAVVCLAVVCLAVVCLAVVGLLLHLPPALDPDPGPVLVVPSTLVDLGTVGQATRVPVRLAVHNPGGRRLILVELSDGCCGGDGEPRSHAIESRGRGVVETFVDTSRWAGRMRQPITFSTNDPQHPRLTVLVTARVTTLAEPAGPVGPVVVADGER